MRIGIHQPNFLPWMGYFYKMSQCDTFVLLDHVEYTKKSFTRRVKIHKPNHLEEDQYIIIPLQKHPDHVAINSLIIVDNDKWQKKIFAQIYNTYHKAPYYYQIEPLLDRFFYQPLSSNSFSEFTVEVIKYISELLDLQSQWLTSSELDIEYSGNDVNFDITSHLNGQTYVSGMGAKKYQDESLFMDSEIELKYSDFASHFETLEFPNHFLNKSVLAYLAFFEVDEIRKIFT